MRRQSKVEVYLHLVRTVKGKQERLTEEYESRIYRCIAGEAEVMGCEILALGGVPDHVHLLVRVPGKVAPAMLAKQVKGASSSLMNKLRPDFSDRFDWQQGYGCFSIGRNLCQSVKQYVRNSKTAPRRRQPLARMGRNRRTRTGRIRRTIKPNLILHVRRTSGARAYRRGF